MRKKKAVLYFAAAAAAVSIGLVACSPGTGAGKETVISVPTGQGTAVSEAQELETPGLGASGQESSEQTDGADQSKVNFSGQSEWAENEIKTSTEKETGKVMKQESAKAPVLRLKLPEDETICSSPAVIQEDGTAIQIQFHDETTQSDAMAWASLEAGGGPSEYYVLDEEGTERQEILAGEKIRVEMTIRKTVENSDIHGILVSWKYEGVFYELWEDDARESADAVVDMVAAIAARSAED